MHNEDTHMYVHYLDKKKCIPIHIASYIVCFNRKIQCIYNTILLLLLHNNILIVHYNTSSCHFGITLQLVCGNGQTSVRH